MQPPTTVTSYNKRIAPAVGLLRKPGTDFKEQPKEIGFDSLPYVERC